MSYCAMASAREPLFASQIPVLAPAVAHGYSRRPMDFHGTLTMALYTFIRDVKDVYCSLAHHGFERILMVNDHGLNASLLDMFARLTMLETNHSIIIKRWVGTWFAGIAR